MFQSLTVYCGLLILCLPCVAWAQKIQPDRLPIGRTHGPGGGTIQSEQVQSDGSRVLHGLQVVYGPKLQIKEYSVYNAGRCEQLVQLYASGNVFRQQTRDHNGDGSEAIYTGERTVTVAEKVIVAGAQDIGPIKTQEVICQGTVKAGRCFSGTFLRQELQGFEVRLMRQEFKDGKLMESRPFPVDKLGLTLEQAAEDKWPWQFPDWPMQP